MAKTCAQCNKEYKGDTCPTCTETGVDIGKVLGSEKEQMEKNEPASAPTAFLVDLVSNRKIPITTPRCRVGRDDLNDIVISGDQSISRFHFIITYEDSQYYVQDAKSRHGTFLNGNQISGPEAINDGDVLKIGVSLFWFVIESAQGGSEESLQPVDVEKIASEELSLKKGSSLAAMSEGELTATMEIDLPTAESLLAAEAKVMEAAEAAKSTKEEESKTAAAEPAESKKEDSEPESKSDEESAKAADKDEEKSEPESEKKDDALAEDEKEEAKDDAKSAKVTSESDIEMTVKDLLEPLQDELEASRAMIKDALKKGNLKDEEPAQSKSEEESKEEEDEPKSKDSDEEKPESKEDDEKKGAEPVSEDEDEKEDEESKSDTLSVSGLDVEPTDIEVTGLDEGKDEDKDDEEPESKDEPEPEPESKDEEPEPESSGKSEEKAEPADKSEEDAEADSSKKDKTSTGKSAEAETLEKIAEIIDDSSSKQEAEPEPEASRENADSQKEGSRDNDGKTTHAEPATMETANGAEEEITIMGPTNVPDWCKKYFSDELKHLTKELDSLNEQIKQTQERIRKIEGKAALTKGLRNTLLTADGDDLIEACVKVLGMAGWKVTQSEDDKNELVLEHGDEQVAIARIIWTKDKAERSHLGQLSISQTRYWCENGVEPKGILILSKLSDKAPTDRSNEAEADLVAYAQQKNVCLMDTVQLLALYRDIALKEAKIDERREKIQDGKGWLSGFELEPGDEADDSEEKEATKGKSLSSLLSA